MKKVLISAAIILCLFVFGLISPKIVNYNTDKGVHINITEQYNVFDNNTTVTITVENGWYEIPLFYFINPVYFTVVNTGSQKTVEIPFNFKDFTNYGSFHQAKKVVPIDLRTYVQTKEVNLK